MRTRVNEKSKMEFLEKKMVNGYRLGEITIKSVEMKKLDTPGCILFTRGGAAPHLTNDLMHNLFDNFTGIHITLPTTIRHPGPDVLKEYGKGIGEFLGLKKKHLVYCSVHDPTQKTQCSYNEEKNVSIWDNSGRKKIDIDQFLELLTSFKPDIVQCLCDTVPNGQPTKRNKKSVDRTLKFLDDILEYQKNCEALKSVGLLGAIEGGDSEVERTRCAVETSKRPVSGFAIEGIDSSIENWTSLLHNSIKSLPRDKPRFLSGPLSPDDICCAFECGVDVFDSSFAYEATQRGCALNMQVTSKLYRPEMNHTTETNHITEPTRRCENSQQPLSSVEREVEEDVVKTRFEINLVSKRYREDFSPLSIGCCCYSCTNHTRAYVYHLLQTKEMLAQILLMTHNFHQYFEFFTNLREAIANDEYENFKNDFLKS